MVITLHTNVIDYIFLFCFMTTDDVGRCVFFTKFLQVVDI